MIWAVVNLGDPADLLYVTGRRCVARWLYVADHPAQNLHVSMGWLPDGRWWASSDVPGPGSGGRLFPAGDDASARAYCSAMMARQGPAGRWREVWPAYAPGVSPGRRLDPPPYPPGDPRGSDQAPG